MRINKIILFYFSFINCFFAISQENGPLLKDIEGNSYKTVKIGNQIWMQENLKVTHYNNGDKIETFKPDTFDLTNTVQPKYQWAYKSSDSIAAIYGRLYTWYVVADNRKICPEGWHVPTDEEFCILENFLEPGFDSNCSIEDHKGKQIGNYLKESGHKHWGDPETGADNRSGFTALPAGIRYLDGYFRNYINYGYFWTSTEFDTAFARTRRLYHNTDDISRSRYKKKDALSVRCIKDE